jgi:hypothetical protein
MKSRQPIARGHAVHGRGYGAALARRLAVPITLLGGTVLLLTSTR